MNICWYSLQRGFHFSSARTWLSQQSSPPLVLKQSWFSNWLRPASKGPGTLFSLKTSMRDIFANTFSERSFFTLLKKNKKKNFLKNCSLFLYSVWYKNMSDPCKYKRHFLSKDESDAWEGKAGSMTEKLTPNFD